MKFWIITLIIGGISLASCKEKDLDIGPEIRFVPTDVIVKTRNTFTIDKVFDFINSYDHDVEIIHNSVFTSSLPSDSLQYVLDYLNKKSESNEHKDWLVTGYLNYQSQVITIFPRFFHVKDKAKQADWLKSMKFVKLKEVTDSKEVGGSVIYFHVPVNEEKEWVRKFKKLDFVEWADLNKYGDYIPL